MTAPGQEAGATGATDASSAPPPRPRKRWYYDLAIYLAIATVSILHYVAPVHAHHLHDIYRRLYYLPIILAAFHRGLRGGLLAAAIVCAAYAPHAFGGISHDPATDTQKVLEMVLYFVIGALTGTLVSRLTGAQRQLGKTADELRGSLVQLRATEEQLIQAAKLAAVGRLSAGLAHEIRNPLASIKGSAEFLSDDFPPEHPKRRLLQVLIDESVRLNQVLTRFLTFARPKPLKRETMDVAQEVDGVISLLSAQKEGRSVRFIRRLPPAPLPRVHGDAEQLRQVLLNVLLNACQAAGPEGEVRVIYALMDEGTLAIQVRDSGTGFTPEALANLFTPFYTTKEQGSGLGLAISHKIVESHGGRICALNDPAGGGVVVIEIPIGGKIANAEIRAEAADV